MRTEVPSRLSFNAPFPQSRIISREAVLAELQKPCGRFTVPASTDEALATYIMEKLRSVDMLGEGQLFLESGTSLGWQRLLSHLHEKRVILEPRFRFPLVENDKPKIFNASLTMDVASRDSDGYMPGAGAFGASQDADEALSKTVGETLERYFLSRYRRDELMKAAPASLGSSALDLRALSTFLPWQKHLFPRFEWTEETPLRWVEGERFSDGAHVYLPAQLVFWNYLHANNNSEEKMLARTTTSGCAGHFTKDEAVLSALLENIQRDGFLVFWLNKIAPPVLDTTQLDDSALQEFLAYFKRYRLSPIFLNTTSDVRVPSITCVLIDHDSPDSPIISVGASSGFDIPGCMMHSAIEALIVNNSTKSSETYSLPDGYKPFTDTSVDRAKRLSMWKGEKMAERFSFFLRGKKQDPCELVEMAGSMTTAKEQLAYVLREFERLGEGYDVFSYEVHDPVLTAVGFSVVRAVVPQLIPLYLSEYAATLDSKRLREVPAKLGYMAAREYNSWPHPFP